MVSVRALTRDVKGEVDLRRSESLLDGAGGMRDVTPEKKKPRPPRTGG